MKRSCRGTIGLQSREVIAAVYKVSFNSQLLYLGNGRKELSGASLRL